MGADLIVDSCCGTTEEVMTSNMDKKKVTRTPRPKSDSRIIESDSESNDEYIAESVTEEYDEREDIDTRRDERQVNKDDNDKSERK